MLEWCRGCQNLANEGYINSACLACKWSYPGQEAFEQKTSLFIPKYKDSARPDDYFAQDESDWFGIEII